jgi:sRNA-binding carbon storage regulator CsrA
VGIEGASEIAVLRAEITQMAEKINSQEVPAEQPEE